MNEILQVAMLAGQMMVKPIGLKKPFGEFVKFTVQNKPKVLQLQLELWHLFVMVAKFIH